MTTTTRLYTIDELMAMPTDEPWEIWKGELRKVPGAGQEASAIAHWIGALITFFVQPRDLGVVTGADGSYVLSLDPLIVVVPDVGFVRRERQPSGTRTKSYAPLAPDLAIEVRSPTDRDADIRDKLRLYRQAGIPLVWWLDPDRRAVSVYRHGILAAELHDGDVLHGEDILPGFSVEVSDIFK